MSLASSEAAEGARNLIAIEISGNANEWSLVRRHPSEKIFGVQLCGSKPQALVPAAEQIVKHCDIDFLG